MKLDTQKVLKTLNPNRVIIPIVIGVAATVFLFLRNFNYDELVENFRNANIGWLILGVFVMLSRDVGYVYRINHITGGQLNLRASIYAIIMWEFASAVSPSVVGGTGVAVFILLMEGIAFGKSLAFVMVTAVLDNIFFILSAPVVFLFAPTDVFPTLNMKLFSLDYKMGLQGLFYISYSLIALYTSIMIYALFARPRAFKWLLIKITSIKFLRTWRYDAAEYGNEIIWASTELRGKSIIYWVKAFGATVYAWVARYFMLNCVLAAFSGISLLGHFNIFARHVIMWVVMLISPTPGSSGTAEIIFPAFYGQFVEEGFSSAASLIWRMGTYWPYLFLGVIVLPRWLKRVFVDKKKAEKIRNGEEDIE